MSVGDGRCQVPDGRLHRHEIRNCPTCRRQYAIRRASGAIVLVLMLTVVGLVMYEFYFAEPMTGSFMIALVILIFLGTPNRPMELL